jgi:hypothetical protein
MRRTWPGRQRRGKDISIAPVQLIVLGFPEPDFHREIIAELERLRESDTVRVVDALEVAHLSNLSDDEAIELGSVVGALIGLGIEGEDGAEAGAEAGAMAAARRAAQEGRMTPVCGVGRTPGSSGSWGRADRGRSCATNPNNHTRALTADEGGAHIAPDRLFPRQPHAVFLSDQGGTYPW